MERNGLMSAKKMYPEDETSENPEQTEIDDMTLDQEEDEPDVNLMGIAGFLRRCPSLLKPYWKQALIVFLAILPEIALETLQPILLMYLIDNAIGSGDYKLLTIIIAALFGLLLTYVLSWFINIYFASRIGANVLNGIRLKIFERLQIMSQSFFNRHKTGDILSRFTSDIDALNDALVSDIPFAISCMLTIIVGSVLMVGIEWRVAIPVLILLPIVNLGPRMLSSRTSMANYKRQRDISRVVSTVEENIAAQPVVKVFGLQNLMVGRFKSDIGKLYKSTIRAELLGSLQGATMTASGHSLLIIAIGISAVMAVRGDISVGAVVALFELLWFVMSSVEELSGVFRPLQRAAAGFSRIQEILDEEPEVVDAEDAVELPPISREISFQNVSFSYTGAEADLSGISVTIPANKAVAIVGTSGSGKSTMLRLLMRFYDPGEGKITIDGHDLRDVTQKSLRSQIGVVFQDSFLFNTTIRENIRLGKPDASDDEIVAAAKAAEIHDAILELPQGYDTPAGEKGGCLSGGERQRIAIARALIRKPAILVLDEPASALDPHTEAAINVTLSRASRERTVISVTHRLASTVNSDLILVLESGRLVEQGTHRELIDASGAYYRLWQEQSGLLNKH